MTRSAEWLFRKSGVNAFDQSFNVQLVSMPMTGHGKE